MPKVHGWFLEAPDLPWEQEEVAFIYDSRIGPRYYSFPMTGLVPYNEPDRKELETAPSPLWITYLDPRGELGKIDSKGDKTFVIDLPNSFEEFLAALPYNHRKELRNNLRRNLDVLVEEGRVEDIDALWDSHIQGVQERCRAEGESPFSEAGVAHLRELFRSPLTSVLSFRINDTLYAVNISFRRSGVVYDSICLRTKIEEVKSRGLGNFAVLKNIESAIRDGFKEYDMLTGDWGYKHKFNAKPRSLKHYIKCTKSFASAYGIPLDEVSVLIDE